MPEAGGCFCCVGSGYSGTLFSQGSDISSFIGIDQKVPPYYLVCFLCNDTKEGFLINWGQHNNAQGVHEHRNFWKNFTVR